VVIADTKKVHVYFILNNIHSFSMLYLSHVGLFL